MRCRRTGPAGLFLVALLALATPAEARQEASLTGRVIDAETQQPISGAQVQLLRGGGANSGGVLTDQAGRFTFRTASGTYSVVVVNVGYETARIDGVDVTAGQTSTLEIALTSRALALNPLVVSISRGREEKALDAPASVAVVTQARIRERAAVTPVEYVKALPGVDVVQTGLTQSNTVTRGFNNVFSGSLLTMTDNRYAFVPSLRFNAYNMIPTTPLDVERIEVLLGPAAALYGPNSASGVMHIITSSPIDDTGTTISLSGGQRDVLHGAFRTAFANANETVGFKISGQYFQGDDWEYMDPVEVSAREDAIAEGADPSTLLVGARSFDAERWGGEARLDFRPFDDDGEIILAAGHNQLVSSVELTGIGAGQANDWGYSYGQARLRKGRLFAQTFMNKSDAGDSYLLRTGQPIVDKSDMIAGQVQYGFLVGDRLDVITGIDAQRTTPKTEGTITGRNEDDDRIDEIGGYVHATLELSDKLDLVGALRVDDHNRLEELNYSPRAALVFKPADAQTFRLTYNRAFSTPSTNNLFLDLRAGRIPLPIPNPAGGFFGFDVRTNGVPTTGFTFNETCQGGVQGLCMYSPFAPTAGRLPANGAVLWNSLVAPTLAFNPQLAPTLAQIGLSPAQFLQIISNPGAGDLNSWLLRFNQEDRDNPFRPDTGPVAVDRIRPTITNTYEAGYKGVVADKLSLSLDVYRSEIKDFVGPLRVETPNVFLTNQSVSAFLRTRLTGAGLPAAVAQGLAAQLAGSAAAIPLGTVAPDQRDNSDLILTYRNFGDVELWGADMGFQFLATNRFSVNGSLSWVSEECFDFNEDGSCTSATDISLNAPKIKGSFGARYVDQISGLSLDGRVRYSDAFIMNSGVYLGEVDSYAVVDANIGYKLPVAAEAMVSLTVSNIFNDVHREFVGAPELGRLALLKLQYTF